MITIGIPVYKRTVYLKELLERCLSQTHEDFEILIGDSSPDDAIKKIIESFSSEKIRYLTYPQDTKVIQKLNALVKEGRGSHMLILCDDDHIEPDYLRAMNQLIRNYPDASLYRCRYRLIGGDGKLIRLDRKNPAYMPPPDFLRHALLTEKDFFKMNVSGIVFERELFLRLGGFIDLPKGWHSDRLAWSMLAALGGCAYEERPLCSVRLHEGSMTSAIDNDLVSAIETDLKTKKIFKGLIESVGERYHSAADKQMLAEARKNLEAYTRRHLSRSLDRGFLSQLSEDKKEVFTSTKKLFQRMKDLEVGSFKSARVYFCLGMLPYSVRRPLLDIVKYYKVRKWCA